MTITPMTLSDEQLEIINDITAAFDAAGALVTEHLGPSRYRGLAFNAIEEGCMWAVKGVMGKTMEEEKGNDKENHERVGK